MIEIELPLIVPTVMSTPALRETALPLAVIEPEISDAPLTVMVTAPPGTLVCHGREWRG